MVQPRAPLRLPHPTGIERARAALRAHVPETPLLRSELLSRALAADVWLKNEPAGAAALAAAWVRRADLRGQRVVLVLTGSNATLPVLAGALSAPSLFDPDSPA